jgi:hydrogenase expression/formation protein HypE
VTARPDGAPDAIAPADPPLDFAAACPAPIGEYEQVVLGHGSGGRLSADLVGRVFLPALGNPVLSALEDQATVALGGERLCMTTDAFVVKPLFFPGGDIGALAVNGTVNDLAVGGATPLYLSAAFVLEEGFPLADLARIAASMRRACDAAGVVLIAADTKVVDHGKGDGVFITTTGVGRAGPRRLSIAHARPGDVVLVSGNLGDHGIAILAAREGIELDTELVSDCAPLHDLCQAVLAAAPDLRCMRDPTRGGLASALNELAAASAVGVRLDEAALPLDPAVRGACEVLGLDPLYVACEGKLCAVVPPDQAESALAAMRGHPLGARAAIVGQVVADHPGVVTATTSIGGERIVAMLAGEQLPRIC